MLLNVQRERREERNRLEKMRQTSGAYDDAPMRAARQDTTSRKGRRQAKARRDVSESIARSNKRKETTAQRIKQYTNRVNTPMFGSDK